MNNRELACSLLSGVAAGALLAAAPVNAQEASGKAQADAAAAGDIIVTARRTEERLQDVPISMTVVSQATIDNRNIVQGSDLAIYTPSLTVNQRFGPETSSFSIRGFLQEANTAPSVGVYFAEVTAPRSLGLTAAGSNLAIGSFMDLENVQVLKGPQGTLFGRNTTGGAILLEPKRPTDNLEGYVEVSAGDYNMRRGQAVLNIPLADTFKVRLGIDRMKRDGYMINHSGIGPRDYNNTDYVYVRASMAADLTPDLEDYLIAHYSKSDTNGFAARLAYCERDPYVRLTLGAGFATGGPACAQLDRQAARGDGPYDVEVNAPNPFFRIEQWQIINHTTWRASDNLTIKNIASYAQYTADLDYNLGGENFLTQASPYNFPPGSPAYGLNFIPVVVGIPIETTHVSVSPNGTHSADQWTMTEELQLQGNTSDGRLNWQAGGYFELSDSPSFNTGYTNVFLSCNDIQALKCFDPYGFGYISNARQKARYIDKALYAQATYKLTEKLSLTGGIRYTWDKLVGTGEYTRFFFPLTAPGTVVRTCADTVRLTNPDGSSPKVITSPDQCREVFPAKSQKPTWLIDLDFKPTPDVLLYAKWARGYRAGGFAPLNTLLETWAPEKLDSYEVGLKASFRGSVNGYFDAAAFYNDFSNQQIVSTTVYKATGLSAGNGIINAGKSTIKGFEIDSSFTFFDSLTLSAGWTYLDTKIKKLTAPSNPIYFITLLAREGDPLPQVPKNRVTLSANYELPLDRSIGSISIGATYVHTDKQLFNRNAAPGFVYLPATDLVNLNINWKDMFGAPVDSSFFVTNLTKQLYPVVNGGSYSTLGYESVQYGAPRMWGFRLKYRFGS